MVSQSFSSIYYYIIIGALLGEYLLSTISSILNMGSISPEIPNEFQDVYDGEKYISVAGNSVEAIDTNGAGDMFAGAFLYAVTQGKDFQTAGKLPSRASAEVVTVYGPRLRADKHKIIAKEIFG